jgi:hypothetical protein
MDCHDDLSLGKNAVYTYSLVYILGKARDLFVGQFLDLEAT